MASNTQNERLEEPTELSGSYGQLRVKECISEPEWVLLVDRV